MAGRSNIRQPVPVVAALVDEVLFRLNSPGLSPGTHSAAHHYYWRTAHTFLSIEAETLIKV